MAFGTRLRTVVVPKYVTRRPLWYATSICILLFIATNMLVQTQRHMLDLAGDTFYGYQRIQRCESLGRVPDILYMGSSRTVYGIMPGMIDTLVRRQTGSATLGCNLGMFGSDFEQDYYLLKHMLADKYVPHMVIETLWEYPLNMTPPSGMTADDRDFNVQEVMRLAALEDLPTVRDHMPSGFDGIPAAIDFITQHIIPLYAERTGIARTLCGDMRLGPCEMATSELAPSQANDYLHADRQGWIAHIESMPDVLPATDALQYTHFFHEGYTGHFTLGGRQPAYLQRMIALAQANNIQIVLVMPPIHPSYLTYFDHPDDWPAIIAFFQQFASEHSVSFYDQSTVLGYTSADFFDPNHLNAMGAERFSTWLSEQVIVPRL
jgi:hypothetical protein